MEGAGQMGECWVSQGERTSMVDKTQFEKPVVGNNGFLPHQIIQQGHLRASPLAID